MIGASPRIRAPSTGFSPCAPSPSRTWAKRRAVGQRRARGKDWDIVEDDGAAAESYAHVTLAQADRHSGETALAFACASPSSPSSCRLLCGVQVWPACACTARWVPTGGLCKCKGCRDETTANAKRDVAQYFDEIAIRSVHDVICFLSSWPVKLPKRSVY